MNLLPFIRKISDRPFERARRLAKRLLCPEILVLGDSHAGVFWHPSFQTRFPKYFFKVVVVHGATASGLENPNSKTQAYPIFRNALEKSKAKKAIVMLGEVDTGFVIWYRAIKYQSPVASMLEKAVESYSSFLSEVAEHREIICISTPLPTIQDGNDWGDVAHARREVRATQFERTELTLAFNTKIQGFCSGKNITYLSLDVKSLGENGLVRKDLLNANPTNHHYDMDCYFSLLIEDLACILK